MGKDLTTLNDMVNPFHIPAHKVYCKEFAMSQVYSLV